MSVQVDRYTTSKFILKDDAAVEYIKKIVDIISDGNISSGYLSDDAYIKLYEYGDRTFKFIGDGFCDSGPEIRPSALRESEEVFDEEEEEESEEDDEWGEDPIQLFDEIQANLAEGTWFFVESHGVEKSYFSSYIAFYHQNGKTDYHYSFDAKRQILQKHGIDGTVD